MSSSSTTTTSSKNNNNNTYIRPAQHAGSWYSSDPDVLAEQLNGFLREAAAANATAATAPSSQPLRALIVPHAGTAYSGPTAAYAYHALQTELLQNNNNNSNKIRQILVLHPSHHVYLPDQCLVSNARVLQTPLGDLTVDDALRNELIQSCGCGRITDPSQDAAEHSGEMQYPFLAHILLQQQQQHNTQQQCSTTTTTTRRKITVTPVMCGSLSTASEQAWGRALSAIMARESVVTIVSTDFCHWGRRFGYTPTTITTTLLLSDGPPPPQQSVAASSSTTTTLPLHKVIQALDQRGMDLVQAQQPGAFATYLQETRNTICGRHAVAVWMRGCAAAAAATVQSSSSSAAQSSDRLSVEFLHYDQSSQVQSMDDSSVSYAAGAAYLVTSDGLL